MRRKKTKTDTSTFGRIPQRIKNTKRFLRLFCVRLFDLRNHRFRVSSLSDWRPSRTMWVREIRSAVRYDPGETPRLEILSCRRRTIAFIGVDANETIRLYLQYACAPPLRHTRKTTQIRVIIACTVYTCRIPRGTPTVMTTTTGDTTMLCCRECAVCMPNTRVRYDRFGNDYFA